MNSVIGGAGCIRDTATTYRTCIHGEMWRPREVHMRGGLVKYVILPAVVTAVIAFLSLERSKERVPTMSSSPLLKPAWASRHISVGKRTFLFVASEGVAEEGLATARRTSDALSTYGGQSTSRSTRGGVSSGHVDSKMGCTWLYDVRLKLERGLDGEEILPAWRGRPGTSASFMVEGERRRGRVLREKVPAAWIWSVEVGSGGGRGERSDGGRG